MKEERCKTTFELIPIITTKETTNERTKESKREIKK